MIFQSSVESKEKGKKKRKSRKTSLGSDVCVISPIESAIYGNCLSKCMELLDLELGLCKESDSATQNMSSGRPKEEGGKNMATLEIR